MNDLPSIFAFAPAAFFGVVTAALTTVTFKRSRRPIPAGDSWDGPVYSALLIATLLAWVVFLLCLALGFAYFETADLFRGWATERD